MRLLLVRHGQTDWNVAKRIQGVTETDLNEAGRRQAYKLGERLLEKGFRLQGIGTSPMRRAVQTSRIVGDMLGISPVVLTGLEEMHMGRWEGMSWTQAQSAYPEAYAARERNPRWAKAPDGECYQELLNRVIPPLQELARHEKGDWLIVTHAGCILALLGEIYRIPFLRVTERFMVINARWICVEGSAILRLRTRKCY